MPLDARQTGVREGLYDHGTRTTRIWTTRLPEQCGGKVHARAVCVLQGIKRGLRGGKKSADTQWNAIERHFPSVIRRVWAHVVRLYPSIDCDFAERPQIQSEINILFHCYGGQNRSASNAIAFIFWLCLFQGGERLTMPEVMERVTRRRPKVIMKGKENHENFTWVLLSFAETLELMKQVMGSDH